jgi:glucokinase
VILGLDLGGTKLLAARVSETGVLGDTRAWPTGRQTSPAALRRLLLEVREWAGPVCAVGLGFPGLVDAARGVARSSVMLEGWADVSLADLTAEALGVSARIANDVDAAALAELRVRRDAGEVVDDLVMVALGTGIGGALILGGRLFTGAGGMAGEIGHVSVAPWDGPLCRCGRRGCLGALAPGRAFTGTRDEVERAVEALGAGLASVLNILNPARLVLGGGVSERGEDLVARIAAAVRAQAMPEIAACCRIERARAGWAAGAWGAGLLALDASGGAS